MSPPGATGAWSSRRKTNAWLAVRTGIALRLAGVAFRQIVGVVGPGGIGFTKVLLIAELAFGDDPNTGFARIGVLLGSVVAGVVGHLILMATLLPPSEQSDI